MRVLLVEDDMIAAKGISLMLKDGGAVVDHVETGDDAIETARHTTYDIIVLDLMLPDMEGFDVVRRLRAARLETPVLILSGMSRPEARVRGLGLGADDFLTKPFDRAELLARAQAVIRRSRGFSRPEIVIGELHINLSNQDVTVRGKRVDLTGKEFQVLKLLAMRRDTILSKEVFLDNLYGGMDEPDMKIIDVFICKLRKKLQAAGAPALISTVWGSGYVLREPKYAKHNTTPVLA